MFCQAGLSLACVWRVSQTRGVKGLACRSGQGPVSSARHGTWVCRHRCKHATGINEHTAHETCCVRAWNGTIAQIKMAVCKAIEQEYQVRSGEASLRPPSSWRLHQWLQARNAAWHPRPGHLRPAEVRQSMQLLILICPLSRPASNKITTKVASSPGVQCTSTSAWQ